jgi:hypothetical protein
LKKAGCLKIEAPLRPLRFDGTDMVAKDSRQLRILNQLFTMERSRAMGQGNVPNPVDAC